MTSLIIKDDEEAIVTKIYIYISMNENEMYFNFDLLSVLT